MAAKPPLPPRSASSLSPIDISSPGSWEEQHSPQFLSPVVSPTIKNSPYPGGLHDPRSSSTQSLRPAEPAGNDRRTLLIVYIHGFLGDETSFKSFPAHVHAILTKSLRETHVAYTKIYPRYKSRKNISFATNDFSKWLAPRESDQTDVILVGHSLGGILAAEVVLLPSDAPSSNGVFRHRILGLLAFDVPYLGMHPGVVGTGIASIFRPPPELAEASLDPSPFSDTADPDPTYNPSYENDVRLATRKGKLQRAWYFWNKHAGEVSKAAGKYVSSHLEFGGCLADYVGLRKRYRSIRALEDVNELAKPRAPNGQLMKRVRFVNYYTSATGPVKQRPPPPKTGQDLLKPPGEDLQLINSTTTTKSTGSDTPQSQTALPNSSPRISLEEHRDGEVITKDVGELDTDLEPPIMSEVSPERLVEVMSGSHEDLHKLQNLEIEDEAEDPPESLLEERSTPVAEVAEEATIREEPRKKQKDRRFCVIPSRDSNGQGDAAWIQVRMEGIDEVQAHTSMFKMGETYVAMVEDTAKRIERWVQEDASRRMILAEMENETWE
ncbi:hypothetical protein PV05_07735 [Exophiala xenobiotica]|uniref:AB hydrolase-1 domain-containing protein n=1 Tax=Exophiala xenobiotica TaxID=348802 RepID=A0A0D2EW66_9EURO|nr:uncharacterized protein PV05_07735 [Exophiala xenobiotica]KIW52064.1 hypothetical protein PV05_07735 [Exophiala xenobiotica]